MKALLGLAVLAVLSIGGVLALSDATKFDGQTEHDGMTQVVFEVDTRNYHHDVADAAASLWYTCVAVVNWEESTAPSRVPGADGDTFEATVHPALGEDSSRRFRGCLEDATIDKVSADVDEMVRIDT